MGSADAPRQRGEMGTPVWVNLALAAGSVLLVLLLAELGLRLAGYAMPRLLPASIRSTYRLEPGARFEYRGFLPGTFEDFANVVELNRLGFHDRDYAFARPLSDTHRVLVLGDSYVAAFEVPVQATFHKRVESRLRQQDPLQAGSYEWIALGQGNRAQEAQLQWLRRYGPRYRPDAVLLVFFAGNDVMENSASLFERAGRFGELYMREVVPRKSAFFDAALVVPGSRLNGLIAEVATQLYAANLYRFRDLTAAQLTSPELGVYEDPPRGPWRRAWQTTLELLDRIDDEARGLEAPLIVAGLSGPQAVGDVGLQRLWGAEAVDWAAPLQRVESWAEARSVPFVDLTPALQEAGRRRVYWRHDAHLTPHGHEVVAATLYEALYGADGHLQGARRR